MAHESGFKWDKLVLCGLLLCIVSHLGAPPDCERTVKIKIKFITTAAIM